MRSTNLEKHTSANPLLQRLIQRFQVRCCDLLRGLDIATVKEVGCGEGFFVKYLYEQFPTWQIQGSDISAEAIEYAAGLVPEARFAVESIFDLPDDEDSYDLVIASEVLEHLPDPAAALREITRVSRRYLLLSVPHEPFFQGTNFVRGKYLRRWGNHPEHIQRWGKRAFRRFVASECSVLSTHSSFPWTIVLAEKP